MRKTIIAICIALLIVAGFIASLPLLLSTETVRSRILSHLNDLTGREVTFRGVPSVSFSPFLGIEITELVVPDLTAGDRVEPLLSVERVAAKLNFLPALLGNVEIDEYQLFRPILNMRTRSDGNANWQFSTGALKDAFDSNRAIIDAGDDRSAYSAKIGTMTIIDGAITYSNEIDGKSENASNVNAALDWPDTNSAMSLDGSAIWRNENVNLDFGVTQPMKLMAGGETDLEIGFQSEPLTYTFSGKANLLADLFIKGEVEASSPSITRLSQFLEFDLGQTGILGEWTASGTLDATAQATLLSEAKIGIDGNFATGLVRLASTEKGAVKLDGTLAFETIDVSNYFSGTSSEAAEVINRPQSRNLGIDLRISSQSVIAQNVTLENVAAAITMTDGDWKFDIGDASAFGGNIVARLESQKADDANNLILKFSAVDADMEELLSIFGEQKLSLEGTGNVDADLRTRSPFTQLTEMDISGSASLQINSGTLRGIDLPAILQSAATQTSENSDTPEAGGDTGFEELSVKVFLNRSNATISKANIKSNAGADIHLIGNLDFRNGSMALRAQEVSDQGPEPERLVIGGTLFNPLLSITERKELPKEPEPESIEGEAENDADG